MLLSNVKDIKLGGTQVNRVYVGTNLVWQNGIYYDGIPCFIDNAYYKDTRGAYNSYLEENNYFLALVDIGTSPQAITFGYGSKGTTAGVMRVYNNDPLLGEVNADYWSVLDADRTVTMIGRYLIFPIRKGFAKQFRVIDADGNYLIKGNEV